MDASFAVEVQLNVRESARLFGAHLKAAAQTNCAAEIGEDRQTAARREIFSGARFRDPSAKFYRVFKVRDSGALIAQSLLNISARSGLRIWRINTLLHAHLTEHAPHVGVPVFFLK